MPCGAFYFSILSTARYSRTKRAQAHAVLPEAVGAGGTTFAAAGAIFLLSAGEAPAVCCSGI